MTRVVGFRVDAVMFWIIEAIQTLDDVSRVEVDKVEVGTPLTRIEHASHASVASLPVEILAVQGVVSVQHVQVLGQLLG